MNKEYLYELLYNQNLTYAEIAKKISKSAGYVQFYRKKYNIPLHPNKKKKYPVNNDYFKTWNHNMAYILGFLLSDGYVGKTFISFVVQKVDEEILQFIQKEISPSRPITDRNRLDARSNKYSHCACIKINSETIIEDLRKLGVRPLKKNRNSIPNIPKEYIWDFIRGIFDGDGSIQLRKLERSYKGDFRAGRVKITFPNLEFLETLKKDFLMDLGSIVKSSTSNCYHWNLSDRKKIIALFSQIYNGNFSLSRKSEKFQDIVNYDQLRSEAAASLSR